MSVLLKGSITPTGAHYHYLSSFKRYMNEINCYWDSLNLTAFKKKTAGNKENNREQGILSYRAEMPARLVCA